MRRKSAGKKLMAVLIAASLALTPAELTVAAEMEPEGEEATFLAEESVDTASSDPEDIAEAGSRYHRWIGYYRGTGNHRYRYREQRTGECGNRRNGVW